MSELIDGLKQTRFCNVKVQADNLRQMYKYLKKRKKFWETLGNRNYMI